jgi:DNA-binding NarL/FixJ family response regulator
MRDDRAARTVDNEGAMNTTKTIRILLADDQTSVRRGLHMRLGIEADMEVVGEATTGETAIESAVELQPDVIVMDVEMPGMGGIAATRRVRAALPGCAVVMLSLYDDTPTRELARMAGASDFVAKHSIDSLLGAIRRAAGDGGG